MEMFNFSEMSLQHVPSYAGVTTQPGWQGAHIKPAQGLLEQLQTSLELPAQLQIFSMAVGKVLPLTSLQMHTAVGEFNAPGSYPGGFEYRSMLVLNEQCLAELVYQSQTSFSALLQRRLLELESQWLFPLRNALIVTRLQQLALRDTLTGLGNRRFFDDAFAKAVLLAERRQQAGALILLDLDNFKQVNDNFGHHTGDDVLVAVAEAMRTTLRASDNLFRFGGDEFAVLLTGEDAPSAELVAHRLVKAIAQMHLCDKYRVSASAGLVSFDGSVTAKELFSLADQALYEAKVAGKNAVRINRVEKSAIISA